jgi:hypothetical protein
MPTCRRRIKHGGLVATPQICIRISVGTSAMLAEGFPSFPQLLHANARAVPRSGQDRILANPLRFIIHLSSYQSKLYGVVKQPSKNK